MDRVSRPQTAAHRSVFPDGLKVSNRGLMEQAAVTRHAWERFVERYILSCFIDYAPGDQLFYIRKLQECFRRAIQVKPPTEIWEEWKRKYSNCPVRCFHDQTTGLYFIVSDNLRRAARIITVSLIKPAK